MKVTPDMLIYLEVIQFASFWIRAHAQFWNRFVIEAGKAQGRIISRDCYVNW